MRFLSVTDAREENLERRSQVRRALDGDETAHVIDVEVRRVIDTADRKAQNLLETNRDKLDAMAAALIKYETIDEQQIKDIMAGRAPKPPADWDDSVGNPPTKRAEGEADGGS